MHATPIGVLQAQISHSHESAFNAPLGAAGQQ
jgi:hypothetical protein